MPKCIVWHEGREKKWLLSRMLDHRWSHLVPPPSVTACSDVTGAKGIARRQLPLRQLVNSVRIQSCKRPIKLFVSAQLTFPHAVALSIANLRPVTDRTRTGTV